MRQSGLLEKNGASGTNASAKKGKKAELPRRRSGDGQPGLLQSVLEGGLEGLRRRAREALAAGWDRAMEAQEGLFFDSRQGKGSRDGGKSGGEA